VDGGLGVVIPTLREVYDPLLDELEAHGVRMKEETRRAN
jgi:hypothetical protein